MHTTRIKPMLPSLREKKRYLAFEVISNESIEKFFHISEAIWESCLSYLGTLGVANSGIWLLPDMWNKETQRGLIKISHKQVHNVKAALTLIKKINRQNVIVKSLGVSGILKKARERYLAG